MVASSSAASSLRNDQPTPNRGATNPSFHFAKDSVRHQSSSPSQLILLTFSCSSGGTPETVRRACPLFPEAPQAAKYSDPPTRCQAAATGFKGFNIFVTRSEEPKEVCAAVPARLGKAKQDEIFPNALWCTCRAYDIPQPRKCLDSVLRVVVVPGNSVMVEERKKSVPILLQALLVSGGNLRPVFAFGQTVEKAIHFLPVPTQMDRFQSA